MEALAEVLGDGSIGAFEVSRLVDRPTDELKREIERFFAEARRDDLLLLYFSCHGVLSQSRRFYFATTTTALNLLRATAIEDSFVNDVMERSRAHSIVLILDCSHSGAFGKGLAPKTRVDVEHRFEGRGRVTLSASTELEYAFEDADPASGMSELGAPPPVRRSPASWSKGSRPATPTSTATGASRSTTSTTTCAGACGTVPPTRRRAWPETSAAGSSSPVVRAGSHRPKWR